MEEEGTSRSQGGTGRPCSRLVDADPHRSGLRTRRAASTGTGALGPSAAGGAGGQQHTEGVAVLVSAGLSRCGAQDSTCGGHGGERHG